MRRISACLLCVLGLAGPAAASPIEIGQPMGCIELVPQIVSTASEPEVPLTVRVLLDGVSEARGRELMTRVQRAYTPLGITLVPSFEAVTFTETDVDKLVGQARALYGGGKPRGIDIVYTATTKDLTSGLTHDTGTAGYSDCIGGVALVERGFAVGEDRVKDDGYPIIPPYSWDVDIPAEIAGHEIGHLLGAHHHYANCAEGVPGDPFDLDACTLMFNDVCCTSLAFGAVEGATVRGHAEKYAGTNTTGPVRPVPPAAPQPQPAQQPERTPTPRQEPPAATSGSSTATAERRRPAAKSKSKSKQPRKHRAAKKRAAKKRAARKPAQRGRRAQSRRS